MKITFENSGIIVEIEISFKEKTIDKKVQYKLEHKNELIEHTTHHFTDLNLLLRKLSEILHYYLYDNNYTISDFIESKD